MSRETPIRNLLFPVDVAAVEAVIVSKGDTRRISIPAKKALINSSTGHVLGVVSRDYRVVTNQEAIDLGHEVCRHAFPEISAAEWEPKRAAAPRTLTYACIDLMHRTHILNYSGAEIKADDPYTPFLRVTNSFNGARALRFDIGFMRRHCSNGVIFEKEVASVSAAHSDEALEKVKVEIKALNLSKMWDEFSKFLATLRGIAMSIEQSSLAIATVLRLPKSKNDDSASRKEGLCALAKDIDSRIAGYRTELGENAYAVFNTLTDVAARPPESPWFQKDRDTIEARAGRWLKELARRSGETGFNLTRWIPTWDAAEPGGRRVPARV